MATTESKRGRITARIPDKMRNTLEEAAELMGATLNQFLVQSAYQQAQRILERESLIHLSRLDAQRVLELMDSPPEPNRKLKKAVKILEETIGAKN
jgi:uncharacterized protein (DUF1778 family)